MNELSYGILNTSDEAQVEAYEKAMYRAFSELK